MNRHFVLILAMLCFTANSLAHELHIGTAVTGIAPPVPVALSGQFNLRIADTIETTLTANVISLVSREENHSIDATVMVSCDLTDIPDKLPGMAPVEVHKQIPELDVHKIIALSDTRSLI
jgi:molecular chaperone DnaK (HSP70)